MIVFWDTQLTIRQNPTSCPTFPGKKVEQKVGHRKNFVNARLFDRLFEAKNSSIESSIG